MSDELLKNRCATEATDRIRQAMGEIGATLCNKYGEKVAYPLFLHIFLCTMLSNIYERAPSEEEADSLINLAFQGVKSLSKYGEKK